MTPRIQFIRELIPAMPLVILQGELDLRGHILSIQQYIIDEVAVIPLFSSESAFFTSTNGGLPGKSIVRIDRGYLVSKLRGDETFLLDARLPSELRFSAEEFRAAFPEPFVMPPARPDTQGLK